jgi:hypothetical protein
MHPPPVAGDGRAGVDVARFILAGRSRLRQCSGADGT